MGFTYFIDTLKRFRGISIGQDGIRGNWWLRITILTGRTIDQGCGKEIGKTSKE